MLTLKVVFLLLKSNIILEPKLVVPLPQRLLGHAITMKLKSNKKQYNQRNKQPELPLSPTHSYLNHIASETRVSYCFRMRSRICIKAPFQQSNVGRRDGQHKVLERRLETEREREKDKMNEYTTHVYLNRQYLPTSCRQIEEKKPVGCGGIVGNQWRR